MLAQRQYPRLAPLAEPLPQPGGLVEPRLLLVERRERAQRALVARHRRAAPLPSRSVARRGIPAARKSRPSSYIARCLQLRCDRARAARAPGARGSRARARRGCGTSRRARSTARRRRCSPRRRARSSLDHGVVVARDQVAERAHVRAAVARRAPQLAIVGHVVATDQHAGGHRAEPDEQEDERRSHSWVRRYSISIQRVAVAGEEELALDLAHAIAPRVAAVGHGEVGALVAVDVEPGDPMPATDLARAVRAPRAAGAAA